MSASAQVEVSVTLSGTVEDMLPILQHLRDMGFGDAADIEVSGGDDAVRMSVHSVMTGEGEEASADEAVAEVVPEGLALFDAKFQPASAKSGGTALLTVSVRDPENRVDTVAATFRDIPDGTLDLFDNGTQGDRKVGDGIWSRRVPVFPQLQAGQHVLEISAFDVNGQPIAEEDGGPVQTDAVLTVTK
jgi:hypothetical protein